jgi:hypothetical protein
MARYPAAHSVALPQKTKIARPREVGRATLRSALGTPSEEIRCRSDTSGRDERPQRQRGRPTI